MKPSRLKLTGRALSFTSIRRRPVMLRQRFRAVCSKFFVRILILKDYFAGEDENRWFFLAGEGIGRQTGESGFLVVGVQVAPTHSTGLRELAAQFIVPLVAHLRFRTGEVQRRVA